MAPSVPHRNRGAVQQAEVRKVATSQAKQAIHKINKHAQKPIVQKAFSKIQQNSTKANAQVETSDSAHVLDATLPKDDKDRDVWARKVYYALLNGPKLNEREAGVKAWELLRSTENIYRNGSSATVVPNENSSAILERSNEESFAQHMKRLTTKTMTDNYIDLTGEPSDDETEDETDADVDGTEPAEDDLNGYDTLMMDHALTRDATATELSARATPQDAVTVDLVESGGGIEAVLSLQQTWSLTLVYPSANIYDPSSYSDYAMASAIVAPRNGGSWRPSDNMRQYMESLVAQPDFVKETRAYDAASVASKGASKESQGAYRVDTPYEHVNQIHAEPNGPSVVAFASDPLPLPLRQTPLPSPAYHETPRLQFRSALEAQLSHQWEPCWKPASGSYGVPQTDREQKSHVARLFKAFLDTRKVYDDSRYAAKFQPGGIWTQDPADIELTCWNLVKAAIDLHVVGATGLQFRRMPQMIPPQKRMETDLTFLRRLFCLELLVKHYKTVAHEIMKRRDVEEYLVQVCGYLFEKCQFNAVMDKMAPPQREALVMEWERRGPVERPQTARSSTTGDQSWQHRKRPLSDPVDAATQFSPKRNHYTTANFAASAVNSPQTLRAFSASPFLNDTVDQISQVPAPRPSNSNLEQGQAPAGDSDTANLPNGTLDGITDGDFTQLTPKPQKDQGPVTEPAILVEGALNGTAGPSFTEDTNESMVLPATGPVQDPVEDFKWDDWVRFPESNEL
ncbi:uncharacterized protein N0V89_007561 [Didymosphaeria variabile]|uniref:Uncharacterized protein n=1 Tax=Didymosphaeria variabile TaxID=1932322 RepID=A0A9W8XJM2_9PLEO|nr:uncharacterized protein N0V89_007561 [Didymosphaeria variabile]KAJ4352214.1 hypothetical protein N0V89_007561 [Didymosphaeria variabile]